VTSGQASTPKRTQSWYGYAWVTAVSVLSVVVVIMLLNGRIFWAQRISSEATISTLADEPHIPEPTAISEHVTDTPPISMLQRAQLATVFILIPDDDGELVRGSGTLVTPCGLVLTNHHVIDQAQQSAMPPGRSLAFIGLAQDVRRPPSLWYLAVSVTTDPIRDLAVLRILARAESGRPIGAQYFETVAVGDSSALELGQGIIGMGYPALGGETLTLTRGSMAGFVDRDGVAFGKTDSELLPGSSGGAVLDDKGRLIGVITAAHVDERTQGRLSYFVLIQQAGALIGQALTEPTPHANLQWAVARFREIAIMN
jgi:S1-C subfamily serine protease